MSVALLAPIARRLPWRTLVPTGVAAGVGCALVAVLGDGSAAELVPVTRVTSVLLAAAVATCLEDGTEQLADAAPVGRLTRRVAIALGATVVALVLWLAVVTGASALAADGAGPGLPVVGLLAELVASCAVGCALGAAIVATSGWRGAALRAAVGVVLAALLTLGHPRTVAWLWALPGSGDEWSTTRTHWIAVGVTGAVVFLVLSRDPARRWRPQRG